MKNKKELREKIIKRYNDFLEIQEKTSKKYKLKLAKYIEDQLKPIKGSTYFKKVDSLLKSVIKNPKKDIDNDFKTGKSNEEIDASKYTFNGFDRPEGTHCRHDYDDKIKNCEIWSKDIDEVNRFMYKIYDGLDLIFVISIDEHDLDSSKLKTELKSDILKSE